MLDIWTDGAALIRQIRQKIEEIPLADDIAEVDKESLICHALEIIKEGKVRKAQWYTGKMSSVRH